MIERKRNTFLPIVSYDESVTDNYMQLQLKVPKMSKLLSHQQSNKDIKHSKNHKF